MKYKSKPNSYIYTDTPCGRVRGLRKDGYHLYRGIRFATAGRWEDPQIVTGWEGEYDATRPGPGCYQAQAFYSATGFNNFYYEQNADKKVFEYSEDCLNLNIWTPENAENCPVAVFIHGGSFVGGSNNGTNICNGSDYCERGVILVNINYRLGAFASVYEEGTTKGNLALKDQLAALQWVKANIAAFGGNPEQVVVMGESAGAISLQNLLYSPLSKGLMKGAVMMSGGGNLDVLGNPTAAEFAKVTWDIIKAKYGVKSITELKDLPPKEIYDAWMEASATDINLANNNAKPFVDGEVIPKTSAELMEAGAVLDVPCILGMSSQDMWPYTLYTRAVEWGKYKERIGGCPVWGYYLDRQLPGGDGVGAYHGCDLWYAFGTLDDNWRPFEEIDYRISDNLIDYLAAFVRSGDPNNGKLARWEPITCESTQFIHLGDEEPSMVQPPVEELLVAPQNTVRPFPGM